MFSLSVSNLFVGKIQNYFLVYFGNLVYFFLIYFLKGGKLLYKCCFGVCHTTRWNSHSINISPPCWASVPPTPLYPTPLGHHRSLGWAPVLYSSFPLAIYFTHGSVYMSVLLFQFVSCHVHKSIIYVCIKVQFLIKVHCKSTKMRILMAIVFYLTQHIKEKYLFLIFIF